MRSFEWFVQAVEVAHPEFIEFASLIVEYKFVVIRISSTLILLLVYSNICNVTTIWILTFLRRDIDKTRFFRRSRLIYYLSYII